VAAAQWVNATINRTMVSVVEGALEIRRGRAERVGEGVYLSFGGVKGATEKLNGESDGP
jgi:hypothetical protein